MTRRRICMVLHGVYPLAETRVVREAHAAQKRGFDVDVVAMRNPGEPAQERLPDGVRVFRIPMSRARGAGASVVLREYVGFTLLAALKVARLHRQQPYDAVQVHNPPDFLIAAGLVPKLFGARLLFDIHDFAPELLAMRFGDRRGGRMLERLMWKVEGIATRVADAVVTVHEPYRRLLTERGVPAEKITVVLNSPEEELLPQGPRPTSDAFRIVWHGTITPHYGLDVLVDALALASDRLPAARVEVYGAGDALGAVKQHAKARGVSRQISFSDGFLDTEDVLRRVYGANVGVVANLAIARNQAALPTKLFEYVALGIPVISSDLTAIREHFDETEIVFYPANDSRALADALIAVSADPAAATARAGRARARYESYRWAVHEERYGRLLDSLAQPSA